MQKRLPLILLILLAAAGIYFASVRQRTQPDFTPEKVAIEEGAPPLPEECGKPTPAQGAGPYYKEGSPERQNMREGSQGEPLVVTGYVFDINCNPVPSAWIDFWQAGTDGRYDLEGFRLRGHQYTNEQGRYRLETVLPAAYGSRPPHIHVKLRGDGPVHTTQLYFPGEDVNVIEIEVREGITYGNFSFVLPY